ncbi:hypothetical protein LWI29_009351 [Acer saccharum]|uniref:RNase H type-1 domain-containing protein n=1 Tax=Acer saccharum TaxID=4024 RepID=A0AA39VWW3_ACESA|nr:hypothetical protein LWI29_009351 [Acer saccharum]
MVFDLTFSVPQSPSVIIRTCAKDWLNANSLAAARQEALLSIRWLEPAEDWVKLNVDGSRNTDSGMISAGGVLRDHWKCWLRGFVTNKGVGSVMEAELWGLYEGLLLAWNAGFRKVLVESDSLHVVQLMHTASKQNHPCFSIIQSCKNLLLADWDCSITHVFREGNRLADGLAFMGQSMATGIVFFDNPPCEIVSIFEADFNGLPCLRQSSVHFSS